MIYQGNKYAYEDSFVIALETVLRGQVKVVLIKPRSLVGFSEAFYVGSDRLIDAPMKYYGGFYGKSVSS